MLHQRRNFSCLVTTVFPLCRLALQAENVSWFVYTETRILVQAIFFGCISGNTGEGMGKIVKRRPIKAVPSSRLPVGATRVLPHGELSETAWNPPQNYPMEGREKVGCFCTSSHFSLAEVSYREYKLLSVSGLSLTLCQQHEKAFR